MRGIEFDWAMQILNVFYAIRHFPDRKTEFSLPHLLNPGRSTRLAM
jgi:hypothetical protein